MITFYDLKTNETIDIENKNINSIEWTEKGIQINDINGNEYLTKIIETQ